MANRFLNNITINDAYTLPSTDGTTGQAIVTDGAGNLTFSTVAAGTADAALKITLTVKNVSGGTLSAGTVVRVAPTNNPPSGNVLEVDVADNSAASTMPAIGVLVDQILDDAEGDCVAFGRASGFSTSGFTEGDALYVNTSGGFTTTKPTGTALIQRIGQVIKVHSSNGSIEIFGAGRANDVPNLSTGKIWVGTATNTAESTLIDVDETNNILTVNGKVYYGNVFSQESDLPSATTYHGMFAHVHGTGYAYYAHAGAWVKLAKLTDINDSTLTLTAGTGLSGGGTFTTNQSSDSAVTVNLDDTAVTPGTYGDANNTPQITVDQQGRITSATTVTTAGSGSGGGGAELSIERNVFTATANQTAFTISSDITASSNTQVYIDGVYQAKSNYTTSGSVVTFSTGVPLGSEVEVVHFIAVYSKIYTDTFTGDGSTVAYTTSKDVSDENETQVYIDGVYQSKDNYTTSGTTITFSTAPPNGTAIEVVHFDAAEYTSLASNQFTGTGSQTDFTLTQEVNEDSSFVFIQGVYQEKSTYSISGTTLTFTTAPLSGYTIEVITSGVVANVTSSPVNSINSLTGSLNIVGGSNITVTPSGNDITIASASTEAFKTISVSGQSDIVADSNTDTLTLVAGSNITLTTDGSTDTVTVSSSDTVGGISWQSTPKTANFTAVAGEGYFVNTTSSEITVTMPSSPSAGDEVHLVDYAGTADTNTIKVASSDKINSTTDEYAISYDRGGVSLVYSDATQGWIAYNAVNETATALAQEVTFDVDFLVVAGAGAGGSYVGGGGGAGGLRTSYGSNSGGGASAESAITVSTLGSYTVTVGSGGSSGSTPTNGNDSTFATVTSTGGGRGATRGGAGAGVGGSGGGGSNGGAAAGTANQGYSGGNGGNGALTSNNAAGGGGGASAAGTASVIGPANYQAGQSQSGDGGDGLSVTILSASNASTASVGEVSGSNVYYAGGGGGGDWGGSSATDGDGGLGGGQSYGATTGNESLGTAGTTNTGGGGSGSGAGAGANAVNSGGSGVVILRYSNVYTITAGGGLTHQTFVESNDKVTVFTAGTGNITFS